MTTTSKTAPTATSATAPAPLPGTVPGIGGLALSRRMLLKMIESLPPDKLLHQPVPGMNHALWIMGHLAGSEDYFRSTAGGFDRAVDQAWIDRFGMGSKPLSDAKAYPPAAEVRRMLDLTRTNLLSWLGTLGSDEWRRPMPKDVQGFAPTLGDLPSAMAAHEGIHVGQLSVIRRSLGIGPMV